MPDNNAKRLKAGSLQTEPVHICADIFGWPPIAFGWLCLVGLFCLNEVLSIWPLVIAFDAEFQAIADDILNIVPGIAICTKRLDIHLIFCRMGFLA
ncbi:hypothetical protein D3C72_1454990 [compost metagenome]